MVLCRWRLGFSSPKSALVECCANFGCDTQLAIRSLWYAICDMQMRDMCWIGFVSMVRLSSQYYYFSELISFQPQIVNNLLTIHFSRCKNGRNKNCRPRDDTRAAGGGWFNSARKGGVYSEKVALFGRIRRILQAVVPPLLLIRSLRDRSRRCSVCCDTRMLLSHISLLFTVRLVELTCVTITEWEYLPLAAL